MVRIQMRGAPHHSQSPRSGAVILDVHDLEFLPGGHRDGRVKAPKIVAEDLYSLGTSADQERENEGSILLAAACQRIVVSYALVREGRATAIVSLGPIFLEEREEQGTPFGPGSPSVMEVAAPPVRPRIYISRYTPPIQIYTAPSAATLSISLDIPSVHVELSKVLLDGLQLWADDLTQLMEVLSRDPAVWESGTEKAHSRESSLIGSRFFAKTRMGSQASGTESGSGSMPSGNSKTSVNETAIKLSVSGSTVS